MQATQLLESQHRTVEDLFERFGSAQSDDKPKIFDEIATALVAHDAIEREIFYPACQEELGKEDDVLGESLVEHEMVELCLFRCQDHRDQDDLEKYVTVLEELVSHHVEEEEKELFQKATRALSDERMEELGVELEERFAEAKQEGFRRPLKASLKRLHLQETSSKRAPKRAPTRAKPKQTTTRRQAAKKRTTSSVKRRGR